MGWLDKLSNGPLSQFGGQSNMARGARLGSMGGPIGMGIGALAGWMMDRRDRNNAVNMGPPSNLAGPDPNVTEGYNMDPNATSMGPPAQDGGHANPQERRDNTGFGDFRSSANYGISPMQANGQNLIVGENGFDPNGGYVYNRRGVGG